MTRDELILSCEECVDNLVKRYNNHEPDEDLKSCGMIAVIECVDRCLKDKMTDSNQIQARCNVWAKNRILNEIYKEKLKYADEEDAEEYLEGQDDLSLELLITSVRQDLTPKQCRYFDLLLEGKNQKEIMAILNCGERQCRYYNAIIRKKIQN